MATKADVTEALNNLKKLTNNPDLTVSNSGGHNLYLKQPGVTGADGVTHERSITNLGASATAAHNSLLDLIQAHWVLTECNR